MRHTRSVVGRRGGCGYPNGVTVIYWHPSVRDLPTILLWGQHQRLWKRHGSSVLAAFREVTGVSFRSGIRVKVAGGWSNTRGRFGSTAGFHARKAISLRYASCNPSDSRVLAETMHELGHRLLEQHEVRSRAIDVDRWIFESHRQLFVFLIDVIEHAFYRDVAVGVIEEMTVGYEDPTRSDQAPYLNAWRWSCGRPAWRRRQLTRRMFTRGMSKLPSR